MKKIFFLLLIILITNCGDFELGLRCYDHDGCEIECEAEELLMTSLPQ